MQNGTIKNPVFIEQIREHAPLSVGETMTVVIGTRQFPMTVKKITGCTIEFIGVDERIVYCP